MWPLSNIKTLFVFFLFIYEVAESMKKMSISSNDLRSANQEKGEVKPSISDQNKNDE